MSAEHGQKISSWRLTDVLNEEVVAVDPRITKELPEYGPGVVLVGLLFLVL